MTKSEKSRIPKGDLGGDRAFWDARTQPKTKEEIEADIRRGWEALGGRFREDEYAAFVAPELGPLPPHLVIEPKPLYGTRWGGEKIIDAAPITTPEGKTIWRT